MPAQGTPAGYPVAYGGTPPSNPTPPPPSQSITPQYATWLVDGPEGRSFAYYLSAGYRRYAKLEDNAHDFEDAAKFLFRAGEVDRGEKVLPELLTMRTLPAYSVDDLLYARQRLMAAFNRGATTIFPKLAASAQVHFDCWMEQQEENSQPQDISQCRRAYEADIVRLETALIPRTPAAPTPSCPPPAAMPACDSNPLFVLFDLGKHDLTSAGRAVLQQAIELTRRTGNTPLIVAAHTDRAGSDAYNDALSKRRLDTVIAALESSGIPKDRLARANYFGETKPRVETPDGVPSQENRRVEIRLACKFTEAESQCMPRPAAESPCAPRPMDGSSACAR
ncbi:MAG: OmpA family protein [Betaproteobacteria bacterium]